MNDEELAALKRKYSVTNEPAKKAELRALLITAGADPDAEEKKEAAPVTRKVPARQTAEKTSPDKPAKRGPGRPASKEIKGSGGITLPSASGGNK